jgi:hypothetical protein
MAVSACFCVSATYIVTLMSRSWRNSIKEVTEYVYSLIVHIFIINGNEGHIFLERNNGIIKLPQMQDADRHTE